MDIPSKLHKSFKLGDNQLLRKTPSTPNDQTDFSSQDSYQKKYQAIIQFTNQNSIDEFRRKIQSNLHRFQIVYQFRQIPLLYVIFQSDILQDLFLMEEIQIIYGNPSIFLCLDTVAEIFKLPKIHKSLLKFNGNGITIGLIDSGIDQSHPDLSRTNIRRISCGNETKSDSTGHGTFLAGILAGSGKMSRNLYQGIVPEVSLLDIKIFDDNGTSSMATLLFGLDQLLNENNTPLPQILLFGCTTGPMVTEYPPLSLYCNLLIDQDVLICAPVGNFGPEPRTIGYPAALPRVLAIGGYDDNNQLCFFSGRAEITNKSLKKDSELPLEKPDLYFPATDIISLCAQGQSFGTQIFDNPYYISVSGTSSATAIAAGMCAILREALPQLSSQEIIKLFKKSGTIPLNMMSYEQYRIPDVYGILREHGLVIGSVPSLWSQIKLAAFISGGFLLLMLFLLFWIL